MKKLSKQALMCVENLTLPSFQVIVINGNLGCGYCRRRVSQLISKMTGLREYTVDVRNKQVTVKGDVKFNCNGGDGAPKKKIKNDGILFKFSLSFLRAVTRCYSI